MENLKITIEQPMTSDFVNAMISYSKEYVYRQTKDPIDAVLAKSAPAVILVDGPSCGGKSGFCSILKKRLKEQDVLAKVISLNSFLKNASEYKDECKKRGTKPYMTSFDALDLEYFEECISLILQGETALLPVYDRRFGVRTELIPFTLRDGQVLILEGRGICSDKISLSLEGCNCVKLYVDLVRGFEANVGNFSANDLRLARKFARDGALYGISAEQIYQEIEYERAQNKQKSLYEQGKYDFTIDTTVAYEPMMLKNELRKVLGRIRTDSRYYMSATKFLSRLNTVPELDRSLLPEDSFYKTFL